MNSQRIGKLERKNERLEREVKLLREQMDVIIRNLYGDNVVPERRGMKIRKS